ncbi:beta-monoglucosyldiacylglycerol synthase [Peptococcaceae bacterium CEB3]|nr:beta-monoglucosyldiacylglycerol synthase [Peptococcaceae bacterium CEB3]
MIIVLTIILAYYLYHLTFLLFSLHIKRPEVGTPRGPGKSTFAVFVPAHNEQRVIVSSVGSILGADYPHGQFSVFVVADNCTDRTVELARRAGAEVLERKNVLQRGKQFALEWAFQQIDLSRYDAVVVLDADNHIDRNFFGVLDYHLGRGDKVIQAYGETQNASDSWVSMNNAYMYWYMYRMMMTRQQLGMSVWLAGTGVCISTQIIRKIGWHVTSLVDDVEYTCQLLLQGERVALAAGAVAYDQKPDNLKDSMRQRLRWIRGQTQVTLKYVPALFVYALRNWFKGNYRAALSAFDAVMWVPMQVILIVSFIYSLISTGPIYFLNMFVMTPVFYLLPVLAEKIKSKTAFGYLLTSGIFFFSWIPVTAWGMVTYAKQGWWRTPH